MKQFIPLAIASTFGVLASVSRRYAHRIPFMVKYNHNELLTYPNAASQIPFGTVREAWNLGACAIGATIYFGSPNATREIVYVAEAFEQPGRGTGRSRTGGVEIDVGTGRVGTGRCRPVPPRADHLRR